MQARLIARNAGPRPQGYRDPIDGFQGSRNMTNRSIRITGRAIERASRRPIEGLRIEAWDQDMLVDDFVGRAERTDADGRFTIRLEDSYFAGLFGERNPDLYFRIFDAGVLVERTAPIVCQLGRPRGAAHEVVVEVEILVDRLASVETPAATPPRRVVGQVRGADGAPALQLRVQAYEVQAGVRRALGEVLTDPDGRYAMVLPGPAGDTPADAPMAIAVQVSDPLGAVLASTNTQVPPRADAAVDIVLGKPWRPTAGVPGRLVDQCHIDLPSDDVVDRMEFERFFRLNAAYGDLMDKPAPTVINLPPQPGSQTPAAPEEAPHPLDIRSLPLAFHLPFTQTWKLEGYTRGRMVNSFALAPGEEQTVDVFTWDRTKSSLESTLSFEQEQSTEASSTRRDTSDVARDVARQNGFEMTTQGKVGFQVGVVNVDLKTDTVGKTSLNEAEKSTRNAIVEATSRATQKVRTSRTLKVSEARETGSEERVTRKLRNPNAHHTLTVAFFEILANYEITTRLDADSVRLVVLIPSAQLSGIGRFDGRLVRAHETTLRLALLDRALAGGFDAARLLDARDRACAVLCKGCDCDGAVVDAGSPDWAALQVDATGAAKSVAEIQARHLRFPLSIPLAEMGKAEGIADINAYLFAQSLKRNAPRLVQDIAGLGIDTSGALPPSAAQIEAVHVMLATLPPEAVVKLRFDEAVASSVWGQIRDAILATLPSGDPISFAINYGIACKRADDIKNKCGGFMSFDDAGLVGRANAFASHYDTWAKNREAARQADDKKAELARIAKEEREARVLEAFGLRETADAQERLQALLDHLNDDRNLDHYRFAVWNERAGSTDDAVMGMALQGLVDPTPVGIVGDRLAVPVRPQADSVLAGFVERTLADLRPQLQAQVQRHLLPTAALHCEAIVGDCSCSEAQALAREQLQTWRLAIDNQAAALEVQRLAARLAAVPPMLDRDGGAKCPPLDIRVTSAAKSDAAG